MLLRCNFPLMKDIDGNFEKNFYASCIAQYNSTPRRESTKKKKQQDEDMPDDDGIDRLVQRESQHLKRGHGDSDSSDEETSDNKKKKKRFLGPRELKPVNQIEREILMQSDDSDMEFENQEALEEHLQKIDNELVVDSSDSSEDETDPEAGVDMNLEREMFGESDVEDDDELLYGK